MENIRVKEAQQAQKYLWISIFDQFHPVKIEAALSTAGKSRFFIVDVTASAHAAMKKSNGYFRKSCISEKRWNAAVIPVSYTHLDVYKRQLPQ